MHITTGGPDDAERVAALHTESWRTAYAGIMPDGFLSGPLYEDRLRLWRGRTERPVPGAALFTAAAPDAEGGELRGFAYLVPRPDGRVLLDNLHARPGRTGSGIGTRLLRHALSWAAAAHPGRDVFLEVLRANARAVAFYERHGARRTDERICRFEGLGEGSDEGSDGAFELAEYEYTWPAEALTAPPGPPPRGGARPGAGGGPPGASGSR
ncbi:hypothetical protein GCM10027168_00070 [Streptomyces capparidis]